MLLEVTELYLMAPHLLVAAVAVLVLVPMVVTILLSKVVAVAAVFQEGVAAVEQQQELGDSLEALCYWEGMVVLVIDCVEEVAAVAVLQGQQQACSERGAEQGMTLTVLRGIVLTGVMVAPVALEE